MNNRPQEEEKKQGEVGRNMQNRLASFNINSLREIQRETTELLKRAHSTQQSVTNLNRS